MYGVSLLVDTWATLLQVYLAFVLCMVFSPIIVDKQVKVKVFIATILYTIITEIWGMIDLVSIWILLIQILMIVITQIRVLKQKFSKAVFITIMYVSCMVLTQYIVIYIVAVAYSVDVVDIVETMDIYRIICTIISVMILIVGVECVKFKIAKRKKVKLEINLFVMGLSIFIGGFLLITLFEYKMIYKMGTASLWIAFGELTNVIVLVGYIINQGERREQDILLSMQQAHNEVLEETLVEMETSFAEWKKHIHDYKHTVIYIKNLLEENRIDELSEYIDKENDRIGNELVYYKTGSSIIDTVILMKSKVAKSKGILCIIDMQTPKSSTMTELDLAMMLGNLLDNAIEAAALSEDKYMSISLERKNAIAKIEIINSCKSEMLNESMETTKKDAAHHGLGLQSVKDIVAKYNGRFCIKINGTEVVTNVEIPIS